MDTKHDGKSSKRTAKNDPTSARGSGSKDTRNPTVRPFASKLASQSRSGGKVGVYPWLEITEDLAEMFRHAIQRRYRSYLKDGNDESDSLDYAYIDFRNKLEYAAARSLYNLIERRLKLENDKVFKSIQKTKDYIFTHEDISEQDAWRAAIEEKCRLLQFLIPTMDEFIYLWNHTQNVV